MPTQLPQDLKRLRFECNRQFAADSATGFAVGEIIRCIDEEVWADEQGVPVKTVDLLNAEISPLFDEVFAATSPVERITAVDRLVEAWRRIQPRIELA